MSNKNKITISSIIIILTIAGLLVWYNRKQEPPNPRIAQLAQCLTNNGVIMYGAWWCPHCQNQKKLFGRAFDYINYIECTKETQKCLAANIQSYPTWIFKNGDKIEGEVSLEILAQKSGCIY